MDVKNLDCSPQQHSVSFYSSPTNESHLTPLDIAATFRSPYPGVLHCGQITSSSSSSSSSSSFNSSLFFRGVPGPDPPSGTDRSGGGGAEASAADLFSVQVESILNGDYVMPGGAAELKRVCQVCGDSASGSHYGVASCEACKAFFKRTVQGNIQYGCPGVNQCEITKHRRKSCQACRFHKCLQAGMMKEGVRRDHVRGGRQKYKFCTETGLRGSGVPGGSRNEVISHLLLTEPAPLTANHDDSTHDISLSALLTLGDLLNRELLLLIGWAKLIPGFSSLSLADQISLMQNGWMEALLVGVVWKSLASEREELLFAENLRLDRHQCQAAGLGAVYEVLRHLVVKYQALNLRPEEAVMMKAMVLGNADTDSIDCPDVVQSFQDGLHDALQEYESCHGERHRVGRLLMSLPLLRQAADAAIQVFLRLHHNHRIPLHKLLLEMIEAKT